MKESHDRDKFGKHGHFNSRSTRSLQLPRARSSPKMCAPKSTATRWCRRAFRPSPTAICTSATPRRSALTLGLPTSSAAKPTCASTTPILKKKSRSTSIPSRRTCAGWASIGSASATRPTTSASSTSGRCSSSRRARLTSMTSPPTRFASTAARSPSPAKTAPIATGRSRKTSTCLCA